MTSSAVADALAELPEVDYVVITAGRFDLLVEAVCEDDEHLLATWSAPASGRCPGSAAPRPSST